jgi:hypothetical protein
VDQSEDRSVGSDAEGDGEDDSDGEAGRFCELAEGRFQVGHGEWTSGTVKWKHAAGKRSPPGHRGTQGVETG